MQKYGEVIIPEQQSEIRLMRNAELSTEKKSREIKEEGQ